MDVKDHYENHLSNFYSWMAGDFVQNSDAFQEFLMANNILPKGSKVAIDLGAGHGIQSVALGRLGFEVWALDFNEKLLKELKINARGLPVKTLLNDIKNIIEYKDLNPELILCCGDTLTHLDSLSAVNNLIRDCSQMLRENGKLILTYRDYSHELKGEQRFIPVKSDEARILTCVLEYEVDRVRVTDLLYENISGQWEQKVSSYFKVRIRPDDVAKMIRETGMEILMNVPVNRFQTVIAQKK